LQASHLAVQGGDCVLLLGDRAALVAGDAANAMPASSPVRPGLLRP
jgi:hypothetical protein